MPKFPSKILNEQPPELKEKAGKLTSYPRDAPMGEKLRPNYSKPRRVTTEYLLIQARRAISELYGEKVGEDWDPVVDLCVIGANPAADPAIRIAALSKAAPYFHAQAQRVVSDDGKPQNIDTQALMRKVATQLLGSPEAAENKISGEPEPEAIYND